MKFSSWELFSFLNDVWLELVQWISFYRSTRHCRDAVAIIGDALAKFGIKTISLV